MGGEKLDQITIAQNIKLIYIVIAIIWSLPWKGVALWKAARNKQPFWFVAILLINTLALLEIVYLLWFQKKAEQFLNSSKKLRNSFNRKIPNLCSKK